MADGDFEPCFTVDEESRVPGRAPRRSPQIREDWRYWIEPVEGGFDLLLRDWDGYLYQCDLRFKCWDAAEAALQGVLCRNGGGLFCNPSDWFAFTQLEEE